MADAPMSMPAEWARHERCVMAWPTQTRADMWQSILDEAMHEYAVVANTVAGFEPVLMVVAPGEAAEARRRLSAEVEVVEIPIDDSWTRDSGPIFVAAPDGTRAGVDFRFNSWGERYHPYDRDAAMSERLLAWLGIPRRASDLVLEGGAISVDGEGTLITTEQCVLHENRNPTRSREDVEAELSARLGIEKVIWLPYGSSRGVTDGHVDGVCVFAGPGVVVLRQSPDPDHVEFERMRANRAVLDAARDARGRRIRVVEMPYYVEFTKGGVDLLLSYINFYLANGGLVVPTFGDPQDEPALELLRDVFPDREVVGVPGRALAYGGGGVHCITQQIPAVAGAPGGGGYPEAARADHRVCG